MVEIIPAIMPESFDDLDMHVKDVARFVDIVQIDVMDGVFVPETTWPYKDKQTFHEIVAKERVLPYADVVRYEVDLMISKPEAYIKSWIQAGARRLIFHIESITDHGYFWKNLAHVKPPVEFLNIEGVEVGLALNIDTPNEALAPHMRKIQFVQFMGIAQIGYQGQDFDERVLHKIESLRKEYPELIISIDGGVSLETAPKLISAGVNRLVSGSAILNSDNKEEAIAQFKSLG